MKTVVLPERVEFERHLARAPTQSTERGDVLVADSERLKRLGQGFAVILRIGAGARDCTDVDDERHRDARHEFDEVLQRPSAVADCVEWGGHSLPLLQSRFGPKGATATMNTGVVASAPCAGLRAPSCRS